MKNNGNKKANSPELNDDLLKNVSGGTETETEKTPKKKEVADLGHISTLDMVERTKDTVFLQSEQQLESASEEFSTNLVKNIDESANQRLKQMDELVEDLKEIFVPKFDVSEP